MDLRTYEDIFFESEKYKVGKSLNRKKFKVLSIARFQECIINNTCLEYDYFDIEFTTLYDVENDINIMVVITNDEGYCSSVKFVYEDFDNYVLNMIKDNSNENKCYRNNLDLIIHEDVFISVRWCEDDDYPKDLKLCSSDFYCSYFSESSGGFLCDAY